MDWKDIGKLIAPIAPIAGSILGGFIPIPGGSIIGQKFGELIAGAFGVTPTPQAVSDAVANSTEETARAKINAALEQARAEIQGFAAVEKIHADAMVAAVTQTNETIRAELGHEHWFFTGWRPAIGWVFAAVALAFGLMLVFAAGVTVYKTPDPLKALSDAWPLFVSYFGVLGLVVGVYIPSRTTEKKAAIENGAAMPNSAPLPLPKVLPVPPAKPANFPFPPTGGSKVIPAPAGSR